MRSGLLREARERKIDCKTVAKPGSRGLQKRNENKSVAKPGSRELQKRNKIERSRNPEIEDLKRETNWTVEKPGDRGSQNRSKDSQKYVCKIKEFYLLSLLTLWDRTSVVMRVRRAVTKIMWGYWSPKATSKLSLWCCAPNPSLRQRFVSRGVLVLEAL